MLHGQTPSRCGGSALQFGPHLLGFPPHPKMCWIPFPQRERIFGVRIPQKNQRFFGQQNRRLLRCRLLLWLAMTYLLFVSGFTLCTIFDIWTLFWDDAQKLCVIFWAVVVRWADVYQLQRKRSHWTKLKWRKYRYGLSTMHPPPKAPLSVGFFFSEMTPGVSWSWSSGVFCSPLHCNIPSGFNSCQGDNFPDTPDVVLMLPSGVSFDTRGCQPESLSLILAGRGCYFSDENRESRAGDAAWQHCTGTISKRKRVTGYRLLFGFFFLTKIHQQIAQAVYCVACRILTHNDFVISFPVH